MWKRMRDERRIVSGAVEPTTPLPGRPISGPPVAYRWDGEAELSLDKMVWV